jgi:hypothetical protein
MNQPQKRRKTVPLTAMQSRQMSIGFESIGLLGLTSAERLKAIGQLARLLMLAAGIAAKERNDER